jgi:TRAP-type mannitol/chloroaromatic compound transport system permease small subunit
VFFARADEAEVGPVSRLLRIAAFFDWPARAIGKMSSWVILPLIGIIMFDVITRKIDFVRLWLANANLSWFNPIIFQDSEWHLHAVIVLLSFGYAYLMNAHVRVDIFREMVPRRGQAKLELFGLVALGIPFLILITYFAGEFVALSISQNEGSESLTGIPARYIVKSLLVVSFVLVLCSFLATVFRLVAWLWGNAATKAQAARELHIFAHEDVELEAEPLKSDLAAKKEQP